MTVTTRILTGAATAALLTGQAWADVTPEEVWQAWTEQSAAMGQTLTEGSRQREGDTLVISGVTSAFATDLGEEAATATTSTIPELRLRDMGDGRVEITLSPEITVSGETEIEGEGTQSVAGKITQEGASIIASGEPEAMTYDYKAAALEYQLAITIPDEGVMNITAGAEGLSGQYGTQIQDGALNAQGTGAAETLSLAVATAPASDVKKARPEMGEMDVLMSYGASTATFDMSWPGDTPAGDLSAALKAGAAVNASLTLGGSDSSAKGTSPDGQPFTMTGTDEGSSLTMAMGDGRISYDVLGRGLNIAMQGGEIPLPVAFSVAEASVGFAMPVLKSDDSQPWRFGLKLSELSLSDMIWGMLDAGGKLPHDPMSLTVDLDGDVKMPVDLLDTDSLNGPDGDANPFADAALNIKTVALEAVGASVTANGALTLPGEGAGPMAMPLGKIDAEATGINTLLESLSAMGLLSESDAMGAGMMLALFTRPVSEGVLASTIEFREDGGIYANGQRIQ